ncbi:uncharacterized protein LOC131284994 [Anopheles ziemanni]|uniref:uncharacterized protein LOC131262805 n=1 Tax=Anopheles coustani TaxID=139045 RepID=UPI0026599464|nr:uncharacterized protein LOC131262805 [Anopheles coustani]XP_058169838.1 uncharacterized protein LOC131284994 [Anopheles ziemanni]
MAANAGAKFFREFFRDSPCRMSYLLKSSEIRSQHLTQKKSHERPQTAPSILLNRASSLVSIRKPNSSTSTVRKDPSRKHPNTTGIGGNENLNTTPQRNPQPSSRKPGGCKVCLPNDPTGFLLNEIDHIRDRILDRPESISCRQAIALVQDIRNRCDAIVLPVDGSETGARVKFFGGRVEGFGKVAQIKRRPSEELAALIAKREKTISQKRMLQSPLSGWFPKGDDRTEFPEAIAPRTKQI